MSIITCTKTNKSISFLEAKACVDPEYRRIRQVTPVSRTKISKKFYCRIEEEPLYNISYKEITQVS